MENEEKTREQLLEELTILKKQYADLELIHNSSGFHIFENQDEIAEDFGCKFAEVANVIFLVLRSDESVGYINSYGCRLLGYSPEEILNKNWFDTCIPGEIREEIRKVFDQLFIGEKQLDNYHTNPVLTKTGEEKMIYWHNLIVLDKVGKITSVISSGEDRTEEVERDKKLYFQEWLLKSAREAISAFDPSGQVIYWGPGAEAEFGFTQEEVLGKHISLAAEKKAKEKNNLRRLRLERNEKWEEEYLVKRKNGEVFWTNAFFSPLHSENGKILGCIRIDTDISERKSREIELRKSLEKVSKKEQEMAALLRGAKALLEHQYFSDAAGAIFEECRSLIKADSGFVLRFSADRKNNEILYMHLGNSGNAGERTEDEYSNLILPMRGLRQQVLHTGETVRINDFQQSGFISGLPENHRLIKNVLFVPLKVDRENVGILVLANKTGGFTKKDIELASAFGELASIAFHNSKMVRALEKSESVFRTLIESAKEAIISVDMDGKIIIWNKAAEKIFGFSDNEIIGKPVSLIIPPEFEYLHDPDRLKQAIMEQTAKILGKSIELDLTTKNGNRFPAELSVSSWKVGDEEYSMGIVQNISERKQRNKEREELINELQRINHELDQFTYSVSHDLKSPLITIQGFAGFLEEDLEKNNLNQVKKDVTEIKMAVGKMKSLVDELLELSRLGRVTNIWSEINFVELAESAVQSISGRITQKKIEINIQPDFPVVFGDPLRLRQVLENLIDNATKFMGDEPEPEIRIGCRQTGEQKIFFVADNGIGVKEDYKDRIFNLFEKLNQDSEGSGIGLSFVKRIIELHNGKIWVEPGINGKGSAFCFTLPGKAEGQGKG